MGFQWFRTITIDRTVGAGLFPVTLDLLSTTFVTGATNSSPLLHRQGLVGFMIRGRSIMRREVILMRIINHGGIILILARMRACGRGHSVESGKL